MRSRVLLVVVAALLVAAVVVLLVEVADRVRADRAVTATAVGEPGCVTAARFTDPDGVTRTVDLHRRGNCRDGDPGDRVTVYYDPDDPSVTAASRAWWWPALLAVLPALLAGLAVRGAWRSEPAATAVVPAFLDPARPDAHLYYDHALGRIEVLLDEVAAERATTDRPSGATDALLDVVQRHLEAMRRCVRGSAVSAAEQHAASIARVVLDEMAADSRLATDLLALRRQLFG